MERLSVGRIALFPSLNENLLRGFVICLPVGSNGVKLSSSPNYIKPKIILIIPYIQSYVFVVIKLIKYTNVDVNYSKK